MTPADVYAALLQIPGRAVMRAQNWGCDSFGGLEYLAFTLGVRTWTFPAYIEADLNDLGGIAPTNWVILDE